jgi:hypothetical protein
MRRALVAASVLALAVAAPAFGVLPFFPSGSVVGEGAPLKAYATLTPTVHLFGDAVTARVAIVADRKWVDPARLRVSTNFRPYRAVGAPRILRIEIGRFAQMTWTWTLRCLTDPCVPRVPPSEKYRVFHFSLIHIEYLAKTGHPLYETTASWPGLEVLSQVSPGVETALHTSLHLDWQYELAPVAAPTYRMSPELLFWFAIGLGALALFAAAGFGRSWYRTVRPRAAAAMESAEPRSTLERALAVLAWAHARGDETLQRKAFERVAGELNVEVDELTRTARELAWSRRTPDDEEVETFAEQARGTGTKPDEEPES